MVTILVVLNNEYDHGVTSSSQI